MFQMQTKIINGFVIPEHDHDCAAVIFASTMDLRVALDYTNQRRTVIQAGGNFGVWAKRLAMLFDKVVTFEPDAENFYCLNQNCVSVDNIVMVAAGLSDKVATAGMVRELGNAGAHYMSGKGTIPLVTIDSFKIDDCDLIYLDIEGYETPALMGAAETIRKCKPVIAIEDKGLHIKYGFREPSDVLREMGYRQVAAIGRDTIWIP